MDMVTIAAIIAAKSCALLAAWVRLRAQQRRERERNRSAVAAVERVTAGDQLEIDQSYSDRSRIRVNITRCAAGTEGRSL